MPEDPAVKQAFLAKGVVKEEGGYPAKRHRDGEHVNMEDGFVRVGDTMKGAVLKAWVRIAILQNIKVESDNAYGNSISL